MAADCSNDEVTINFSFCYLMGCVSASPQTGASVGFGGWPPKFGGSIYATTGDVPTTGTAAMACYFGCLGGYKNDDSDEVGSIIGVGSPGFFVGPYTPAFPGR